MYYAYVLLGKKGNRLYIGSSANPAERLLSHNTGKVKSTKNNRPWRQILLEVYPDRVRAESRERYLKSGWGRHWLSRNVLLKD